MKEKWVQICQIQGYENISDCYWISNSDEDKVINRNIGRIKKNRLSKHGYKKVELSIIGGGMKSCKIHVIKARAFLYTPNPLAYNVVRHLNDIRTDNRLENLVWGTQSDNIQDCIRNGKFNYEAAVRGAIKGAVKGATISAKKTSKPVRCLETGMIYPSTREAERILGINHTCIGHCCNHVKKYKTAGGFHWEFVNKEELEEGI